jgi:hypothetical protein
MREQLSMLEEAVVSKFCRSLDFRWEVDDNGVWRYIEIAAVVEVEYGQQD